ncbi:MAG: 3'-5' exonuclease [Pirellulales bacterium]|nr:3'-5' exonuclease [Pirellulales bacterium]
MKKWGNHERHEIRKKTDRSWVISRRTTGVGGRFKSASFVVALPCFASFAVEPLLPVAYWAAPSLPATLATTAFFFPGRPPVSSGDVQFLVFDVESAADGPLVERLRYPKESIGPTEAVRRYREELLAKYDSDFIPYTFQVPVSVAVAKVAADFRLLDLVALDEPEFRPHVIAENFWRGWERYGRPTLVSFNGRGFDVPLLELAAFRYGLNVSGWFGTAGKSYDQPRNRYNARAHIDLCEMLTNFGATRFTGGLNLAANLLGKPGKIDVQGDMVQDMHDAGRLVEINDYCRRDVLDTYFVFLRTRVLVGQIPLDVEHQLIAQTKKWIEDRADQVQAYRHYLDHWGDWPNPWQTESEGAA